MRAAASRTFCTAGRSRPIRMAMMAITTRSSISVKPGLREVERDMGMNLGRTKVMDDSGSADYGRNAPRCEPVRGMIGVDVEPERGRHRRSDHADGPRAGSAGAARARARWN